MQDVCICTVAVCGVHPGLRHAYPPLLLAAQLHPPLRLDGCRPLDSVMCEGLNGSGNSRQLGRDNEDASVESSWQVCNRNESWQPAVPHLPQPAYHAYVGILALAYQPCSSACSCTDNIETRWCVGNGMALQLPCRCAPYPHLVEARALATWPAHQVAAFVY